MKSYIQKLQNPSGRHPLLQMVLLACLFGGILCAVADDEESDETILHEEQATLLSGTYGNRRKGELALEDGIYAAAREYFQQYRNEAEEQEPDFADATILLMQTFLLEDRPARAETAYRYYKNNSPGLENSHYRDRLEYWHIRTLRAAGKIDEALNKINDFVDTTDYPALRAEALQIKAGIQVTEDRDYERAIGTYEQLIDEYEPYIDIHPYLALIQSYLAADNLEKAGEIFAQAETKLPEGKKANLHSRLALHEGMIELQQDNLEAALEIYSEIESYISAAENKAETWTFLSSLVDACLEEKRYDKLLSIIPQALQVAPAKKDKADLSFKRAVAFIEEERLERAIEVLEQLKEDYPDEEITLQGEFRLGELLRETDNISLAASHFNNIAENEDAPRNLRYQAAVKEGECFKTAERYNNAATAFSGAADLAEDKDDKANLLTLAADATYQAENFSNAAMRYKNIADNFQDTEFAEQARLKQAQARAKAELFSDAASTYKKFIEEYPDSEMLETALLERGVALSKAENHSSAIELFQEFAEEHSESSKFPAAMMEGFYIAKSAGEFEESLNFVQRLQTEQPDSELLTESRYQEINLLFLLQRTEEAVSKAEEFIDDYEKLPLTADVLLWLGDSLANRNKLDKAHQTFLEVVSLHPETPQARLGYLEAARCAAKQKDIEGALELLDLLVEEFEREEKSDVHARAYLMTGDIHAEKGNFDQALTAFEKAEKTAESPRLRFTTIGRIGDMHYSLATGDVNENEREAGLQKSISRYKSIIEAENSPADIAENAKYRMGKCFEKAGETDMAIEKYLDVFYQYQIDLMEREIRSWYYFARSGYDAARLLLLQGNREQAARVYERLAQSGIPSAAEAARQAASIRQGEDDGRLLDFLSPDFFRQ